MEKFYLEKPSIERKKEIIDFLYEFVKYNSDVNGAGSLYSIFEGYTFEQALERCTKMEDEEYAKKIGKCNGKVFLLIRENDNKIVGMINVRWNLTPEVLKFGGHIGYGIRPTERQKGYNKINLYLGLIEAKNIGLDKVMLDCAKTNIASDKTIKDLGGILKRCEIDPWDNELTNVYWIDVLSSLEKYKNTYDKYISNKNLMKKNMNSNSNKNKNKK